MGLHSSSAHLKRRRKRSDIQSQSRLTTYRGALYFQWNYCTRKYKESRGTKNIRDYVVKVHRFPLLSSMAIDIFSIPAMSSETERVYSGAKHTITDERSSLHIDTIEVLECLK